ncbi:MAG: 3-dehydroquinate synthase family protein [Bdellovibrionales bacterium]
MSSQLHFKDKLPSRKFWLEELQLQLDSTVVIYDRKLKGNPILRSLNKIFSHKIPVGGGEKLKSIAELEKLSVKIMHDKNLDLNVARLTFVSIGGGSVGDAIGFLASIFKRGVRWINIPSTWLSVVDSAHGGKTAINLKGLKNQWGSFYAPTDVVVIKPLLVGQPSHLAQESLGEVAKTTLLRADRFSETLKKNTPWKAEKIWDHLSRLIEVKTEIVEKDPYETQKIRYLLNWGHTFGHVFESQTGKPHGYCVGQGLVYEIYFSHFIGKLSKAEFMEYLDILKTQFAIRPEKWTSGISKSKFFRLMKNDKKAKGSDKVNVVLVHDRGKFSIVPLSIESMWMAYRAFQKEYLL